MLESVKWRLNYNAQQWYIFCTYIDLCVINKIISLGTYKKIYIRLDLLFFKHTTYSEDIKYTSRHQRLTGGMNEVLNAGSYVIGEKSTTSSESIVLLRTRLLLAFKPSSDKARLFRPSWPTLLHVVRNKDGVCCWEQSTRLVVMLQTAAWWSGNSCRKLSSFEAFVAQEQYFCTSSPVFSSAGSAEKNYLVK